MYRMAPPNLPPVLTAFNFLIGKAQSTRRAECDVTSLVYRNNGIPGNVKDNTHILLSATWWNGYYRYVTTTSTKHRYLYIINGIENKRAHVSRSFQKLL